MTQSDGTATVDARAVRRDVEDFLYREAELLDQWRLDDWLELFTEDARYVVPNCDLPDGDPQTDLVLISDDYSRMQARVKRLNSRLAHREFPHSRTRRLISNVRVLDDDGDEVSITANFIVYRGRANQQHFYVGRYLYRLVRRNGGFLIRFRRAELDLEKLDPHGTVSIIL